MKKLIYALLILSIAGAALAALLLIQHYFPSSEIAGMTCGDGLDNPCYNLSMSGYASVAGVPLAGLGLFFYLFILFTVLVADYAGENYYNAAAILAVPLCAAAIAADVVLGAILVKTGQFCILCVATYVVNILMLASGILWVRSALRSAQTSALSLIRQTFGSIAASAGGRAALGLFVLFTALLGFSVFSTTNILQHKSGKKELTEKQVTDYVSSFYSTESEELNLPESSIILGNPGAPVTIIAFTDFLCSACNSFFDSEKYLLTRFPGKVNIAYYNFPLDRSCNQTVNRTVYENSCLAAKAVNAAAQLGILKEYLKVHFNHYKDIKHEYSEETALFIFQETLKYIQNKTTPDEFRRKYTSDTVDTIIRNDIELAKENDINSTPTLFIGGRRMRGAPPKEMLERIIKIELSKKTGDTK